MFVLTTTKTTKKRIKKRTVNYFENNFRFFQLGYTTIPRKMKLHDAFLLVAASYCLVRFHSSVNKNDHLIVYRFDCCKVAGICVHTWLVCMWVYVYYWVCLISNTFSTQHKQKRQGKQSSLNRWNRKQFILSFSSGRFKILENKLQKINANRLGWGGLEGKMGEKITNIKSGTNQRQQK